MAVSTGADLADAYRAAKPGDQIVIVRHKPAWWWHLHEMRRRRHKRLMRRRG